MGETANMMTQKREILMMMVFPMMKTMMMIMMAFLTKKMVMMTMMAFLTKMIMTMIIMMILIMMVFPMMKTVMMTMMVFLTTRMLKMTMMAFLTKNMRRRIQKKSQRMILKKALLVLLGFPLPFLPLSLGASLEMSCDKKEQMNLLQYHFTYHYLSFIFQIFNR